MVSQQPDVLSLTLEVKTVAGLCRLALAELEVAASLQSFATLLLTALVPLESGSQREGRAGALTETCALSKPRHRPSDMWVVWGLK